MYKDAYVLQVDSLIAGYGKKEVLHNVSMSIRLGEVVALIGPNGSGKSTVLKSILGLISPKGGMIIYEGTEITHLPPNRRVASGLVYVPQGGRVFWDLTVIDNLRMGGYLLTHRKEREQQVYERLNFFPELEKRRTQRAGNLSGGERQMLALSMAMMQKPKVLLLDEPSIGLSPILVEQLMDKILQINVELGVSILVVEQNVVQALVISKRVYVLREGHVVVEGPAQDFAGGARLDRIYLAD